MELPAKRLESTRQFTIADRFHRATSYRTSRKHITGILLLVLALTSFQAPVWSRVQPAWVARYNDSLSRGTNEVIAMQFDPEGNVLIAGSSTSASGDYDYLVFKYGRSTYTHHFESLDFITGSALFGYELNRGKSYKILAVYRPAGPHGPGFTSPETELKVPNLGRFAGNPHLPAESVRIVSEYARIGLARF